MTLFGAHKVNKGTANEVVHMLEHYFKRRGLNSHDQQVDGAEGYGWWVIEGSARIYIFVQKGATGVVLRITSPILRLPKTNQEGFYRRLLDINADLNSCALATYEDTVLVIAQRPILDLEQAELDGLIWQVAYVADLLDNKLSAEFGAPMYN